MLSTEDMQNILLRLMYKPGWEAQIYETEAQGTWIAFSAQVPNSYDNGETNVDLQIESPLPPFQTNEEFLRWLRWRLERIEVHEVHEWLRWKDTKKPVWDPHEEGATKPRSYK